MNILQKIKEKTAYVANDNSHIMVRYDKIPAYVTDVIIPNVKESKWNWDWHYKGQNEEDTLAYLLILDAINFGSGYFSELKKKQGINSGYATVAIYLKEEFLKNPIDAKTLTTIDKNDCVRIFKQDIKNPNIVDLMNKFALAMQELGDFILTNYLGSFSGFVLSANHSAAILVEKLSKLKLFEDIALYKGQEIPILKRAQITVGDIYTAFDGKGVGQFDDIAELTIFADNVVPHVLRYDGILDYSDELKEMIDSGVALSAGDEREIALRACSIFAVEKIIKELKKQGCEDIISLYIDHFLWKRGHKEPYISKKRHIAKTIYY